YRAGEPVRDIFRVIGANVRQPDKVLGDLRAQVNANVRGGAGLAALAAAYGVPVLRAGMAEVISRDEAQVPHAARNMPEGTYRFEDHLDDVGPGTEPVLARVAVTIKDGGVTVDWAGSGPQREAGLNSYLHYTYAYSIAAVKSVTVPTAPQNDG